MTSRTSISSKEDPREFTAKALRAMWGFAPETQRAKAQPAPSATTPSQKREPSS